MKKNRHTRFLTLAIGLLLFCALIQGSFSIYRELKEDEIDLNILDPSTTFVVTFNPNQGTIAPEDASRNRTYNQEVGTLPTAEKTGHNFIGWYTDPTDGTKITSSTLVTGTVTYYAHYAKIVCKKAPAGSLHTETCDSSGSCHTSNYYAANATITYGTIPGNDSPQAGDAYDCDVNDDGTYDPLTERFYYIREVVDNTGSEPIGNGYLVHFTSFDQDGQMDSSKTRENYVYDEAINCLPTASTWDNSALISMNGNVTRFINREDIAAACGDIGGNSFATCQFFLEHSRFQSENLGRAGIWLEKEGNTLYRIQTQSLTAAVAPETNSKNTARPVIQVPSNTIEGYRERELYRITFDSNEGSPVPYIEKYDGQKLGPLTTPTKTGFTFGGWFTDNEDFTTEVTENTIVTGNATYYAKWLENITVNFNANGTGATVSPSSKTVAKGTAIGELPTPEWTGREFSGWYTEATGGTEVTANTIINAATTIYAHWIEADEIPYVFYIPGECSFTSSGLTNGTNGNCISTINPTGSNIDYTVSSLSNKKYIDTGIPLYDATNNDKDYEIGFTIVSYSTAGQADRATLMNTKAEINTTTVKYPGVVFRRNNTTDDFLLQSRETLAANAEYTVASSTVENVKVYRTDGSIYYSINGGPKTLLNSLENFNPIFDLTVWFGAAPKNAAATTVQRYFVGTLSNMYIKLEPDVEELVEVTFDPNYEGAQTTTQNVIKNSAIGNLGEPDARTGYTFLGWFTDPTGGTEITSSTIVSSDVTYYAHWVETATITLHPGNGTVTPNTITLTSGSTVGDLLPTPTYAGHTFLGWYEESTFDTLVTSETVVSSNTDYYAKWVQNVTITLHPGDGTVTPNTITLAPGSTVGDLLPTPEWTGHTFLGWYEESTFDTLVTSETVVSSDTDYYAKWVQDVTITLHPGDGTVTPNTITLAPGNTVGDLLPTPTYAGHTFLGWYEESTFDTLVTSETVVSSDTDYYAKWAQNVIVTLHPGNGTVTPNTLEYLPGSVVGDTLPTPTYTGYRFDGWYEESTFDNLVTEQTIITSNTTDFYAKWTFIDYEAQIGEQKYLTLAEAIAAVPTTGVKTTVTILKDITATATTTIPNNKWVELDIGTYTISTNTGTFSLFTNKGKLDIINGNLYSSAGYIVENFYNTTLNISGGTLTYDNSNETEHKVIEIKGGTVNITGGTLSCNSKAAAINVNAGTLNISGGQIKGTNTFKGQAIYNNGGTTNISGTAYLENTSQTATQNGRACVHNFSGTVNITGGTIVSKKNAAVKNNGTMTIGTDDTPIDTTSPIIQGNNYGLEIVSGYPVTIYDGIFKGGAGSNPAKAINDEALTSHGTAIITHDTETIEGVTYDVAYLVEPSTNYTVTFNPNSGTIKAGDPNTKTYTDVGTVGEMPEASKANTEFLGWFTAATGGERVLTTTVVDDDITYYAHYTSQVTVCRPATTLHSSSGTDFGQIPSSGTLSAGDAFDCDVNGDGTYDATSERFYYLTDTSNGNAAFIFANNTSQVNSSAAATCGANGVNYGTFAEGPNTAIEELPTTEQWSNVSIYTMPRNITNGSGTTVVSDYIYTGKAARFATLDEIKAATNTSINGTANELASYPFLLENTISYDSNCRSNYWLETQASQGAYRINGAADGKNLGNATGTSAVRPVIEVPYSSIDGAIQIVEFDTIPDAMRNYFNNVATWNNGMSDAYTSDTVNGFKTYNDTMNANLDNYNCVVYNGDDVSTPQKGSVYCDQPNKYDTGVTGDINVYEYNEQTGVASNTIATYVSNDNGKLYNFIPGKTYYWESDTDSTKNGYVRPTGERRLITIPGTTRMTRNVRDLGGLPVDTNGDGTIDGKTKFAKIYRGEKIWGTSHDGTTRQQFEKLGIYNEFDLRTQGSGEIVYAQEDQLTNYTPYEIVHYKIDHTEFGSPATETQFNGKSYYQLARDSAIDVMKKIVAGNDDYAIYFHCRVGADRTGTLAYILEGLLGVPTEYRHQDYELTTFFGLNARTRYYYKKDSNTYRYIYLKKAIRHATPGNNEITGEENVLDWFLLEGNSTDECSDITALINQFRTKMIDYN